MDPMDRLRIKRLIKALDKRQERYGGKQEQLTCREKGKSEDKERERERVGDRKTQRLRKLVRKMD